MFVKWVDRFPDNFEYLKIDVRDSIQESIQEHIERAILFIES